MGARASYTRGRKQNMSKMNTERITVIEMAMGDLEEISVPAVSKMVVDASDGKFEYTHVKCAVYSEIKRRVRDGKLFQIIGTYPPRYTKNAAEAANKAIIRRKVEKKQIKVSTRNTHNNNPLIGKSINEVISWISGYLLSYELRPEAVAAYQSKIASLTEEITNLKNTHTAERARMKNEYDKLNTTIKSMKELLTT